MFGALKRGFRSMASLILVRNVLGELQPKRTLAASRGFLAAARLSCFHKRLRILDQFLHPYNRPTTQQDYKFLFSYLKLCRSYAILSATT